MNMNEIVEIIEKKGGSIEYFLRREYDCGKIGEYKRLLSANIKNLDIYRYKIDTDVSSFMFKVDDKEVTKENFIEILLEL
jgi:hypothetical protein